MGGNEVGGVVESGGRGLAGGAASSYLHPTAQTNQTGFRVGTESGCTENEASLIDLNTIEDSG